MTTTISKHKGQPMQHERKQGHNNEQQPADQQQTKTQRTVLMYLQKYSEMLSFDAIVC